MSYEDISDFEINGKVFDILHDGGPDFVVNDNGTSLDVVGEVDCLGAHGEHEQRLERYAVIDYCNNPSDAWPIIEENKIDIRHNYESEDQCGPTALIGDDDDYLYWLTGENILRSAMIIYLKMQEAL